MAAFLHWPIGVRPGAPAVSMREVDIRALNRCGNRVHRRLMRHISTPGHLFSNNTSADHLGRSSRMTSGTDRPFARHALLSLAPSTASLTRGPRARPLRRLGWLDPRHATVDHHAVAFAAAFFALASVPDPGGTAMLAGRRKLIGHFAPFGVRPPSSRWPGGSRTEASLRTSQAGDELVVSAPKSAIHDRPFGEFAIGALVGCEARNRARRARIRQGPSAWRTPGKSGGRTARMMAAIVGR